ncbi:MAG: penicillin amidase [Cyanobacteria bacterium]|nr:penicillin amidase [Cyanobacteria bacterium bin.51]
MLAALIAPLPVRSQTTAAVGTDPSSKGAEVYCFMRQSGNDHEVSWTAAYALIKRQSASLFKTSPQHGAVMITEAVVNNPSAFPDCGRYLGALFGSERGASTPVQSAPAGTSSFAEGPMAIPSGGTTRDDRYNY